MLPTALFLPIRRMEDVRDFVRFLHKMVNTILSCE